MQQRNLRPRLYEAQVVDRDSRMQGINGPGAISTNCTENQRGSAGRKVAKL